jgi:hypothetical protein
MVKRKGQESREAPRKVLKDCLRSGGGDERVLPLFPHRCESPDTVPWTGLQATTRAYARILDEVTSFR